MSASMGTNSYGKDGIRLVLVRREPRRHELRDLTVGIRLAGDFDRVHIEGDNSAVLPTDTMRSTVYALAQEHLTGCIEDFGVAVARRLLSVTPAASTARVELVEHRWTRSSVAGALHAHAFESGSAERATASVTVDRGGQVDVHSGLDGLSLLKTTDSAFSGFLRDELTVLPETEDRILATEVAADWAHLPGHTPAYDVERAAARRALVETFASHRSRSVQHTLHAMGAALLAACPDAADVHLRLPNKHHVAVDLQAVGLTNDRAVFVATDRPYGVIEGTVTRG
jgi:urate oxidase